jgi:hypothetical protein
LIKAIETEYNGCLYRSRLEARWAVFFDNLNINYDYEKEGFEINTERYLPDFWIRDWNCWVEIKPNILRKNHTENDIDESKKIEKIFRLCRNLSDNSNNVVLLIGGSPWIEGTISLNDLIENDRYTFNYEIVVFYPRTIMESNDFDGSLMKTHFSLKMEIDGIFNRLSHGFYNKTETNSLYWFIENEYKNNPKYFYKPMPKIGDVYSLIEADKTYYYKRHQEQNMHWKYDLCSDKYVFKIINDQIYLSDIFNAREYQNIKLLKAYINAKRARFEKYD